MRMKILYARENFHAGEQNDPQDVARDDIR